MSKPYTCPRCGSHNTDVCPTCTVEWENRRDVSSMTPEERVAELDSWCSVLVIEFTKLHQRIEELVGRPVWTHELADLALLRREILIGESPTMEGVIAKLPPDMQVIAVEIDGED